MAGIQEKGEERAGGGRSKRVRSRRKNEKLCKYQCFIFHNKIRDKRRKLPRENGRELRIQYYYVTDCNGCCITFSF